ncbi:hypothetical protein ATK36_3042 [Amycolatopsis sulphurea]|uniref:GDSL-like lipase/acylhydrolase family protein n=1 Tax=Amycolatopsis sulphurea TaxID=76022 RepID=A0A2A9F9E4_9PSEU|nr:hypothetical protein ATK36_3042 [Amycolatopsis sulphurea]
MSTTARACGQLRAVRRFCRCWWLVSVPWHFSGCFSSSCWRRSSRCGRSGFAGRPRGCPAPWGPPRTPPAWAFPCESRFSANPPWTGSVRPPTPRRSPGSSRTRSPRAGGKCDGRRSAGAGRPRGRCGASWFPGRGLPICRVVVLGVNDTLALCSAARFRRDLLGIVVDAWRRIGGVPVVPAGAAPVGRFPGLPRSLRDVLGGRSNALDRAARELTRLPRVTPILFPAGLLHPGPAGYREWAAVLAEGSQVVTFRRHLGEAGCPFGQRI